MAESIKNYLNRDRYICYNTIYKNYDLGSVEMEKKLSILREKGYKITPQRRAVITALEEFGKFPTAQNILESVKKTQPDVSLDTIYRNLTLLAEVGIVHEIHRHTGNIYEIVTPGHHHHHLVCTECGRTECLDICPVNDAYVREAEKKGFQITGHTFEFYGICHDCNTGNKK